jgi:hypothetical protein
MSNILGKGIFLTTPPTLLKISGKNIPTKIYINTRGKRMVIYGGKLFFLTTPPYVSQNIAHDFLIYGLFK